MGSTALPPTMHAWRKHKGNRNPVWEELPLPLTPATGFLVKLLASGGTIQFTSSSEFKIFFSNISLCHSDQPLLDIEDRPQFNEKYTLTPALNARGICGFNALQIVRAIGARVIISDLRQEKLDAALKLGVPAEDIVPVGKSVQDFVKENGLQGKIDTILEFLVRPGGKILCVGTLDLVNGLDMKIGIRKRLSIIFTYGGQYRDLVEVLDLIAKGVIQPQVELGKLQDFPRVLKELGEGKIKDRIALVSDLV
ncbi:hypothetical protein N7449_006379 [Penicillium cf. viridicatum]|uniref:Alcohol dehydrogenase-like C-terminal domain-containing protein n=1 Tax=Penicillium cf. viridicatum TaxID=2972119 RepID=A0A9W9JJ68_9EURO|nr:hypothetical protein N7449_006379 [Penicillium cf. viridicatum]